MNRNFCSTSQEREEVKIESYIAGGYENSIMLEATIEDRLAVSYETKHTLTI